MKPLSLEEIRRMIHGRRLVDAEEALVHGVTTDTRSAGPGELFFAITGPRFDGHEFLSAAADAGCVAAVVHLDHQISPGLAKRFAGGLIAVRDTVRALGDLGGAHRKALPADVVGVTGSNGKTTVKRMIHHILSRRLSGTCSPKSFNNAIGVPMTLLGAVASDDYVICEIGSSGPGSVSTDKSVPSTRFTALMRTSTDRSSTGR